MNFPFRPRLTARALAFSFLILVPPAAFGADATLQAPGADTALADRLRGASASVAASGETNVQEILAAALSDYRTLVQVLYDAGHFAPVVNIRLDGREAALIEPLNPPQSVSKVEISVQPGPRFAFGKAELSPLPRQSDVEFPEEYAPGQPASTGAIRDAAAAGVRPGGAAVMPRPRWRTRRSPPITCRPAWMPSCGWPLARDCALAGWP